MKTFVLCHLSDLVNNEPAAVVTGQSEEDAMSSLGARDADYDCLVTGRTVSFPNPSEKLLNLGIKKEDVLTLHEVITL